ncbi:Gx transporter family protein [Natronospira bacteriovora]|uniref:Gx transporter family protein n=1 Tax=Natronospira bacteriovora TaxID=3069753 RepID=A0ABU0WA26_9GAMM|nr:Gx transporter family protein [Natronospira sp. AB-CW4]MDQ2070603.1 Gx transporter family protein [Natronospira sp. AB-CW4]
MTASISEHRSREDRLIVGLATLAVIVHVLETAIPSPIPGLRPGLANAITLIVLFRHGWRIAAWVNLLRVVAGSLLIGTFLTPAFLLSLSGAITTLLMLGLLMPLMRLGLGPVGAGALASLAHVGGQLLLAWLIFIPHPGLWAMAPWLMAAALPLGIMTGLVAVETLRRLEGSEPEEHIHVRKREGKTRA